MRGFGLVPWALHAQVDECHSELNIIKISLAFTTSRIPVVRVGFKNLEVHMSGHIKGDTMS